LIVTNGATLGTGPVEVTSGGTLQMDGNGMAFSLASTINDSVFSVSGTGTEYTIPNLTGVGLAQLGQTTVGVGTALKVTTLEQATVFNSGVLTIGGTGLTGPLTGIGDTLAGRTTVPAGATLNVTRIKQDRLDANGTVIIRGSSRTTSELNTLSIPGTTDAWKGTVDLKQNLMVVRNGDAATIENQVKSGLYNGTNGYWDGPGINSSTAAGDTNFYTGVGVLDNSLAGYTEFGDATGLTGSEVLVRYTFYGDADLSGMVDFDVDYILWQTGFVNGFTGWAYGDFDHNGVVDFDTDYILWQTSFVNQMALPGAPAGVPEPGTLVMIGLGLAGMMVRRRGRKA
jgi:hypothetical protein